MTTKQLIDLITGSTLYYCADWESSWVSLDPKDSKNGLYAYLAKTPISVSQFPFRELFTDDILIFRNVSRVYQVFDELRWEVDMCESLDPLSACELVESTRITMEKYNA